MLHLNPLCTLVGFTLDLRCGKTKSGETPIPRRRRANTMTGGENKEAAAAAAAATFGQGNGPAPVIMSQAQFQNMMAGMAAQMTQMMATAQQQQVAQQPAAEVAADGVALANNQAPQQQIRGDRFSKRMPEFWPERPTMWFEMLESQFQESGVVEQRSQFRALLQLIDLPARDLIDGMMRNPPADCYDQAKAVLLKQYERTEEELMEELMAVSSLGDRTPLQMLRYLQSLCPRTCTCSAVRVVLRRVLPDAARQGTRHLDDLEQIAERATAIIKATTGSAVLQVSRPEQSPLPAQPEIAAVQQRRSGPRNVVCDRHLQYGRRAFECERPDSCPMKDFVRSRPSGNGPAGRR